MTPPGSPAPAAPQRWPTNPQTPGRGESPGHPERNPAKMEIKLLATCDATAIEYTVTFTGAGADAAAAEYLTAREATHTFELPAEDENDYTTAPLTFAAIFPFCEHG